MPQPKLSSRFMLFTGLVLALVLAAVWWNTFNYYNHHSADLLRAWQIFQQQTSGQILHFIRSWSEDPAAAASLSPTAARRDLAGLFDLDQENGLTGVTWVLIDGKVAYHQMPDFPEEYFGLSVEEVFDRQASLGAADYHAAAEAMASGKDGAGFYTWAVGESPRYAAWSAADVSGHTWVIGRSAARSDILQAAGFYQDLTFWIAISALLTLLLLICYATLVHRRAVEAARLQNLEDSIAERNQDLLRSERRYRTLVENLREGILIFDPVSEQTQYSNPAATEIFGKLRRDGDTQPLDLLSLLVPEDRQRLSAILMRQLTDPTPATGYYQARTVNGAPLWLEIRTTLLEFEGHPANVLLINNFTERRRVEAALRESEERYRGIFNGVQDAILLVDHAGNILDVNASACEMFGFTRGEFLKKTLAEICDPETIPVIARDPEELAAIIPTAPIEAWNINANGQRFPVEISVSPHIMNGVTVALVVVHDITMRKEAEETVRQANRQIDQMMASIPDTLWSAELQEDGRMLLKYISPVFEKMTGYPPDCLKGDLRNWTELIYPADRELFRAEMEKFLDGKTRSHELEYRVQCKDGQVIIVRDRQSARLGPNGRIQLDGVLTDVTETRRVEQQLKRTNRDLSLTVKELRLRHHEVSLLNEMSDLLQSCLSPEDTYAVVSRLAKHIFPDYSGGLYLFNSEGPAEPVATWGPDAPQYKTLHTADCWGLRRSRMHVHDQDSSELHCQHVPPGFDSAYLCAPMAAQGEVLGLLHLVTGEPTLPSRHVQLAEAMARQLALALSNLRLREELQAQAMQDALTGLYNRRYMETALRDILSRTQDQQEPLGIILLDIDRFKQCNDSFGHEAGDQLLHDFGQLLKKQFNHRNIACRYGGDEFVILMPGQELSATLAEAERLRANFRDLKVFYQGTQLHFNTLSLGVAAYPVHGSQPSELLHRADLALYEAKSAGGDHVVVARG